MKRIAALFIIAPGLAVAWLLGNILRRKGGLGADGIDEWTTAIILLTLAVEIILAIFAIWWWGFR